MASNNNLSIIGAGGVKNLVSLGDFDDWLDQRVNDRFSGGGDIAKFYQAVPWLFRGTMLRAQAIASFPFDIVRLGETEPIDPADYETELSFIPDITTKLWLIEASLTLTGKAYLRNLRNRIYIKEVRYYAPTTITPKYDKATGELVGYTRKANGQTTELTPAEITAFWYPDPFAEIGEPTHYPAQAARAASGVMFNLALFQELFFGRGAIKASVISAPANTQEKERKRLKDWFQSMFFGGINTAHTVEVVNADAVKVTTIGEGVKELENTNLSQEKREDIAAALTIPQTMLFSGSAAGLGGGGVTDADDIRFVNEFKIPEFRFVANLLNRGVLVPNGYRMIPMPERLDALHDDEAALAATASTYADLLDKCANYETWEALAAMTGIEYDETQFKKVFVLKESRRADAQAAEQARLEAQARQPLPANMDVSKPDPKQLAAGDNTKAIGGGDAPTSDLLDRGSIEGNRIPVPPVAMDSAAKALERKQFKTWLANGKHIDRGFTFKHLDADEQAELTGVKKKNSNVKSVSDAADEFCTYIHIYIETFWTRQRQDQNVRNDLRELVSTWVDRVYYTGLADAGVAADEYSDEDATKVDELIFDQMQYVDGFAEAVIEAKADKDKRDGVSARADVWCNSMRAIGENAFNAAQGGLFEFGLRDGAEPSDESCDTCEGMMGQRHTWKWIEKNGYQLTVGNTAYTCGVWNCPHEWKPVKR